MNFDAGNIVLAKGKLGVVLDSNFAPDMIRVITFQNPSYWGDHYNKKNVVFVMAGHPSIVDQIRNLNSVDECIKRYVDGNLNNGTKYYLLKYIGIKPTSDKIGSELLFRDWGFYEDLFSLLFDLKDLDMCKIWLDKNLPPDQDKDDIIKGCKFLLETMTKSKVI